jgi:hypothetical protein
MIAAIGWPAAVAIGLGVLLVVASAWSWPRLSHWARDRRQCRDLARGSGLDAEQTALAWRLARSLSPALPLAVFVRPSLWELAVARVGASPEAVAAIRTRLFGDGGSA